MKNVLLILVLCAAINFADKAATTMVRITKKITHLPCVVNIIHPDTNLLDLLPKYLSRLP